MTCSPLVTPSRNRTVQSSFTIRIDAIFTTGIEATFTKAVDVTSRMCAPLACVAPATPVNAPAT